METRSTRKMITESDVFEAARELVAAGEQPSTLAVHKLLKRGSYSTIQKHLRVWEESDEAQAARIEELPSVADLPEALQQDAIMLIKKIWYAAQQEASATIEKEREALAQAQAEAEKAKQEAIDYADQLAERAEDLEEQLEQAKAQNTKLNDAIRDLQHENDKTTLQNENLVVEVKRLESEIERLKANDNESIKAISLALQKQTEKQAELIELIAEREKRI